MEVIWSTMALSQLKDILIKVQEDYGMHTAQKTYDKIDSRVNSLLRFPEKGTPDYTYSSLSAKSNVLIRHLLVAPNVIYYNVDGDTINIMLLSHTKQSPRTVRNMIKRYFAQQSD